MEIALATRAIRPAPAPFVMVISNDPEDAIDPADEFEGPQNEVKQAQIEVKQVQKENLERRKRAGVDSTSL